MLAGALANLLARAPCKRNHSYRASHETQYSPLPTPLGAPLLSLNQQRSSNFAQDGAATRSRTLDLLITSELLYQLSYGGQNGCEILKNEYGQRNRHPEFYCGSSVAAGRNDTSPLVTTRVTPFCSNRSPPVISTPRTIPSCDSPPKTKIAA